MKKLVEMCPELSNKRFAFYEQQFREGNDTDYTQMAIRANLSHVDDISYTLVPPK